MCAAKWWKRKMFKYSDLSHCWWPTNVMRYWICDTRQVKLHHLKFRYYQDSYKHVLKFEICFWYQKITMFFTFFNNRLAPDVFEYLFLFQYVIDGSVDLILNLFYKFTTKMVVITPAFNQIVNFQSSCGIDMPTSLR